MHERNVIQFLSVLSSCAAVSLTGPALAQGDTAEGEKLYGPPVLEEIIVTAQKIGEERSLDTPLSVSALNQETIEKRSLLEMNDYLRNLPGTNFIDRGTARNSVIIRGITTDPGRGGVITGMYIDETPVAGLGFADTGSPDLKLVDVERVEVLRGPQGTLYGAGSMAGTVRTLTRSPDLESFGGRLKLGGSNTSGAGDFNHDIEAVLNLPLADQRFAIRAVAYQIDDSGYIDNVAASDPNKLAGVEAFGARLSDRIDDRGNRETDGYRLTALWRASDRLDVRFMALGQETDQDGVPTIDVLQGPYEQSRFARLDGTDEAMVDDLELYSLTLEYTTGNWTLLSVSSWVDYESAIDYDVGIFFLDFFDGVEPPIWIHQGFQNEVFTQELRWLWDGGSDWRLLLGAYYEDRTSGFDQYQAWEGKDYSLGGNRDESSSTQSSVFADLTWRLADQWDLALGGRYLDYSSGGGEHKKFSETTDTWKLGVNWRPKLANGNDSPLVYLTWSEGFRPGYPLPDPPPQCDPDGDGIIDTIGLPHRDIKSDDLQSFELGYKALFSGGRMSLELAVFHIDWDNLQVQLPGKPPCDFTLPFNAGAAESQGIEFSLNALLTDRLQLDFSASLINVELTEDAPNIGSDGDRLPGAPEYNAAIGLEYGFTINEYESWARADLAWVGDYSNNFIGTGPELGDYTTMNLSGGVYLGNWSVDVYVQNLTDEDAATWANPIWVPYDRLSRLRPRTIGARLGYSFGN